MADVLDVPQGRFTLERYPPRPGSPLRAWDSADEYVLHHLAQARPDGSHWLIVNDTSGSLATALADRRPLVWADSLMTELALAANLVANGLERSAAGFLPSTEPLPELVGVALVKVPRSMALLEHQLRELKPRLARGAVVVGAGMTRQVHTSTVEAFERLIGPTVTSKARKKARLILSDVDETLGAGPPPFPARFALEGGIEVVGHAGVFSYEHLDMGTRLLLEHLPTPDPGHTAIDLGCGSGILGVAMALAEPDARVCFRDVSYLAVASAKATAAASGCAAESCRFDVADGLGDLEPGTVDLIVNNPPFHEDNVMGDAIAWQMFTESRRALRRGGELWVVGNRHLGYHAKLKRVFGGEAVATVASSPKFVVLRARRA